MSDREDGAAQADYDFDNLNNVGTFLADLVSAPLPEPSRSDEFQQGYDERFEQRCG